MGILWSPDGQAVFVPSCFETNRLKEGYRTQPPAPVPEAQIGQVRPEARESVQLVGGTSVNTASLKELTLLPQIGTSIGKKVISNRPYTCVEDLIERVPEVDWMALRMMINVTQEQEAVEDAVDGIGEDTAA